MAKTNFTKVEKAIEEEQRKQFKENLLKEADLASGALPQSSSDETDQKKILAERKILLQSLAVDLKTFTDYLFENEFHVTKEKLSKFLKKGDALEEADWTFLRKLKKKINSYKKNQDSYNETLVQQERKKHINKRLNVREKWLPLK